MAREDTLELLFRLWDGEVEAPPRIDRMIKALSGSDPETWAPHLVAAANADCRSLPRSAADLASFPPAVRLNTARRLGWVIKTLSTSGRLALQQPRRDDPALEAALHVVVCWDEGGSFWRAAARSIDDGRDVAVALEAALKSRVAHPAVPANATIWVREMYDALAEADLAHDWERLGGLLHRTVLSSYDPPGRQAVLGLHLLDMDRLVRIADGANTWTGHMLLEPLQPVEALGIATASRSGHVRFMALELMRRIPGPYDPRAQRALRNLLIRLGHEPDWPGFLAYCNRYPIRFPFMQVALGQALARSGQGVIEAYVDSLSLKNGGGELRACVNECFESFRGTACVERRHVMWARGHERSLAWNYGSEDNEILNQIVRGVLDYATMGWLVEFAPTQDPDTTFEHGLGTLEAEWHASIPSLISAFFRLLSRYQLQAHAEAAATSGQWLPDGRLYTPRVAGNAYLLRRYRWNGKLESPADR